MKLFLIVILYVLESLLQHYTRKPLLSCTLLLCGIVLSVLTEVGNQSGGILLYNSIVQGILYASVTVYLHDVLLVSK